MKDQTMEFKPGVYEDVPYEIYAEIPAFRSHDLTAALKCAYNWKYSKGFAPSPALLEGRVQHTVFLEHHKFDEEFVIQPNIDRRTKVGKAEYEDFLTTVDNRTPISQDLYDICMERREIVKEYIPQEDHKVECVIMFEWHGHPFKCRLDWYNNKDVWDLKTARDASPRGFKQAINNFNYHMQAALYVDACNAVGLPAGTFNFLAQEKVHPFAYAVYSMSDEALEYGRSKNEQALALLLECKEKGEYKPYNLNGIQTIELHDLY